MSYGISVDVGTSYTAAAIVRSGEVPQVLPLGLRAASIPSVIFLGTDGASVVGEAAERRGLVQPERVAREFKRRVGDSVPLVMGELSVLAEDLYATMVRHVVDLAEEREGEAPTSITLTHPAEWGGHKIESIRRAVAGVGITEVMLITEPEAAALSYASSQRVAAGSTLAVYDLGGGTFDATVLRKADSDSFAILGTPSGLERLGGADFDQAVFAHVVESLPEVFAALDPTAPETLPALARLRRECAEAKEALSTDADTTIPVFLPGVHEQVRLVRSEFESMIEPDLRGTIEVLGAALAEAEVEPQALSAILLIGGSSRIPLVAQLLSDEFERPLAVDADPKASIALGAAFATAALTEEPAAASAPDGEPEVPADTHSFTPHHGPEAMATNRKLGLRVALLVGAVALIGVATASAAGMGSPFTVPSSVAAGPGQESAPSSDATDDTPQEDGGSGKDPVSTDGAADEGSGSAAGEDPGSVGVAPGKIREGIKAASGDDEESEDAGKPSSSTSPTSDPRTSAADESDAASPTPRPSGPGTTDATTPAPGTPGATPLTPPPSAPGTAGPTSPAPGTPGPTTPAPTSPVPGTPSPTTPAPGTPGPTTPAPTTPVPGTPDPTTPAPTTDPGAPAPGVGDPGPPSEEPSSPAPSLQGGTNAPSEG